MLTLGQAAKETGVSKPTISKAISRGRLSASKNEKGEFQIEPSELFRVFPPASSQHVSVLQSETSVYANELQRELDLIRDERTRERHQLEATISDLRAERERLLKVIEEQAGTVKQLTHQPEPKGDPAPPHIEPKPAGKGRLWENFFGRHY